MVSDQKQPFVQGQPIDILLTDSVLNLDSCMASVSTAACGGTCVFVGTVRNHTAARSVVALEFEAYGPMALTEMENIALEALDKWPVSRIAIHHRTGRLAIGETAVIIAVAGGHRDEAFAACRFAIDTLKMTVPIWKKEIFEDGEVWVAAHP